MIIAHQGRARTIATAAAARARGEAFRANAGLFAVTLSLQWGLGLSGSRQ